MDNACLSEPRNGPSGDPDRRSNEGVPAPAEDQSPPVSVPFRAGDCTIGTPDPVPGEVAALIEASIAGKKVLPQCPPPVEFWAAARQSAVSPASQERRRGELLEALDGPVGCPQLEAPESVRAGAARPSVSSDSTIPPAPPIGSTSTARIASRSRCDMNHAVFRVTPRVR